MQYSVNGPVYFGANGEAEPGSPDSLPSSKISMPFATPFWSNIDVVSHGRIFQRIETDAQDLQTIESILNQAYPEKSFGQLQYAVIITWWEVPYPSLDGDRVSDYNTGC